MLKFIPLLKQTLWGGNKIIPFKHLDSQLDNVGESWEISGLKGRETVVAEGEYKGMRLDALLAEKKAELVGKANYERFGNEFPLLIKFIDARRQLSVQVHPNDIIAKTLGEKHGKSEMWYVMESEPTAKLDIGMKMQITPEQYKAMVANDTITDAVNEYSVKEGDVFYIPAGRVHSIGAGCFLAEIQQTSDTTYRIYDFKRKDKDGNYRELHVKEAAECIDFNVIDDYQTHYVPLKDKGVELIQCPHFTTSVYDLSEPMQLDYSDLDSFVILIGVKGSGMVEDGDGNTTSLNAGETILLPATTTKVRVSGSIRFLETFV